ncbi:Uncharacterized protein HZ326_28916 [Fusarium oxysporum f. sp. albedinis]|nr:Uncharacterized protein HZ326_28916 [Fusarium oxysporum f. sp. albedinis]
MAKSMYCRQRWIYVDNASQWYRCLEVIVKPHESYDILSYTQDFLFQRDLFVYNSGVYSALARSSMSSRLLLHCIPVDKLNVCNHKNHNFAASMSRLIVHVEKDWLGNAHDKSTKYIFSDPKTSKI